MTSPSGLTCQEFVEIVTDYHEGVMPAEEKARFEAHLASCPGCETYLDQMQKTIQWTGKLPEEQISAEAQEKLLKVFHDWKAQI